MNFLDIITSRPEKFASNLTSVTSIIVKHDLSWKSEEHKNPMRFIRHLTFECKSALEEVYEEDKKAKIESAKIVLSLQIGGSYASKRNHQPDRNTVAKLSHWVKKLT